MGGAYTVSLTWLEGPLGTIAAAAGGGGQRLPWAILSNAAKSFAVPNILRQCRGFLRQERLQPIHEAPTVAVNSGGPLGCARIVAMQG